MKNATQAKHLVEDIRNLNYTDDLKAKVATVYALLAIAEALEK